MRGLFDDFESAAPEFAHRQHSPGNRGTTTAPGDRKTSPIDRPLAARMRPAGLDQVVGQTHLLGPGCLLRRMIEADRIQSVVLYGPPGTGKTTLASVIARSTRRRFQSLNAAASGVKELRELLDASRRILETTGQASVLFVDELHHFNRQQQTTLLPDVEDGVVSLVAATTANPHFALIAPLLSRSQLFELRLLADDELIALMQRALADPTDGFGHFPITADPEALAFLALQNSGDARRALSSLELAVKTLPGFSRAQTAGPSEAELDPAELRLTLVHVRECTASRAIAYDGSGDEHYDLASALIKSIRGSAVDAALYWLARMLEAGEDPRFVARRLMISASEDIGNADPQALVLATAAAQATEMIGMPEARIPLAQTVVYLALAPKSDASYQAIGRALTEVRERPLISVPPAVRDRNSTTGRREESRGVYRHPHADPRGWVEQDYLGAERQFFQAGVHGFERELARRLERLKAGLGWLEPAKLEPADSSATSPIEDSSPAQTTEAPPPPSARRPRSTRPAAS